MRVVHIIGGDIKLGAHRGAYWLHRGMREIGIDSTVITTSGGDPDDGDVVGISENRIDRIKDQMARIVDAVLVLPYRNRARRIFSTGFFGRRVGRHPAVERADIVNIHWAAKGPISVRAAGRLSKPVVWTMRDMWPFTGGCHYAMGCDYYKHGCGNCPQLGSRRSWDLSRLVAKLKRKNKPGNLTYVGISTWLSECARTSSIVGDTPVTTIANCIDSTAFFALGKADARKRIGIANDKYVIVAGAHSLLNFYKGFDLFVEAVNQLNPDKYRIVLFGKLAGEGVSSLTAECRVLGHIGTDSELRAIYSAANVFVAPSRQEAFGKTLVEAMACGTPVACFDATGPKDIVEHRGTGFKAAPFDSMDLARGIEWICEHQEYDGMCARARERALQSFDKTVVARQYVQLYQRMLSSEVPR